MYIDDYKTQVPLGLTYVQKILFYFSTYNEFIISLLSKNLEQITDILIERTPTMNNIGLLNGKMGVSLYFFHLAKETGNPIHQELAEQLIDEVYKEVGNNQMTPDFENGLAGIAWGVEHLVQNGFVEAETDIILSDADDKIYRYILTTQGKNSDVNVQAILGYMLYVISRLNGKDLEVSDFNTAFFKRLLIDLINWSGTGLEEKKLIFQEPRLFNSMWQLPISLILFSKCLVIKIHSNKIERILDYLTPYILSFYPRFTSHRLYLLLGIESVLEQINLPQWRKHAELLKNNISISHILDELKNKNIFYEDGITGIASISRQLYQITGDPSFQFQKEVFIKKLQISEFFKKGLKETNEKELGFISGLTGIAVELLKMLSDGE